MRHAYERSRFLRGVDVDEAQIADVAEPPVDAEAEPMRYLHPSRREIAWLDKPLSFDDAQHAIWLASPPIVIVGGAGSGKTALTLEKLKRISGQALYVTHSAYLARSARELYFADGFERDDQDIGFLSYREFLETLRIPPGREATWREFGGWFERQRQAFRGLDAHQAYEEIRGVIAAEAGGVLSREAYLALGVRQSIYGSEDRPRVYDLFLRYRTWLAGAGLYDLGLLAQEWLSLAQARYDFVVVDEVQDLTPAQLLLVLRTLKAAGSFMLCGDSNQIVHPNFFSWSRVKTLFWRDEQLAARQPLNVLRANFRNGREVTAVANRLLLVKQRRFGSVDRESNFLVESVGEAQGGVTLHPDREDVRRSLDEQTRRAASVAVIVLRDEDKAQARRHFRTPLVFAVHEAKGLEYESIVLYRFVSDHRSDYGEVAAGVTAADLTGETLEYARAHDKTDKSLEIWKFYVNALYVALTRAVRNVHLVESDTEHPLLRLLGLSPSASQVKVDAREATQEEWRQEARRLELQGKQEQAEAVRRTFLQETPVPWPVLDEKLVRDKLVAVFRTRTPGGKLRQQLYEYAAFHDLPVLAHWLVETDGYNAARAFGNQRAMLANKYLNDYRSRSFKGVLQQCEQYGLEHRTPMNQTPLMAAAMVGNAALVEALLERGADVEASDDFGWNAFHWALHAAFREPAYARGAFGAIYERIAPGAIDLDSGERLVRLDRHQSEYLVFQTLWVLFRTSLAASGWNERAGVATATILGAWEHLPAGVLRPERRRRAHLSSVLSRNEVERDYAYNRRLFKRIAHGWYQLNPALAIRRTGTEAWQPVLVALNQPFAHEFAHPMQWAVSRGLWLAAGRGELPVPIAAESWAAREQAEREAEAREDRALEERIERARALAEAARAAAERPAPQPAPAAAPWGTKAAKHAAREELARRIAKLRDEHAAPPDPEDK